MKRVVLVLFAGAIAVFSSCRAEEFVSGTIADERCGSMHDWDEHAPPLTERECTLMCIKSGAKYVFVSGNQVHAIANQDHPGLAEHAGRTVRVTGRVQDRTLTISRFETP